MSISWGDYLTRGTQVDSLPSSPSYLFQFPACLEMPSFWEYLVSHGWCGLEIDGDLIDEIEEFEFWDKLFDLAFKQSSKINSNDDILFHNKMGVNVGYRKEGIMEFLETRQYIKSKHIEPQIAIPGYYDIVSDLFPFLSNIGSHILIGLARNLGLDPNSFLSLTDLMFHTGSGLVSKTEWLSSSVLRVCKYPADGKGDILFGEHTDTTFLTVGLLSQRPGFEVLDPVSNQWLNAEMEILKWWNLNCKTMNRHSAPNCTLIFLGELVSLLTNGLIPAVVHRVRSPSQGSRISCPLLIRGRPEAVIRWRCPSKFIHSNPEILLNRSCDLDGIDMGSLHRFLDMKRSKCGKEGAEHDFSWVLETANLKSLALAQQRVPSKE